MIGKDTKFKSLEAGVMSGNGGTVWAYTAYSDANVPLPPDNNPASIFKRVFSEVGGDQTRDHEAARRAQDRARRGHGRLRHRSRPSSAPTTRPRWRRTSPRSAISRRASPRPLRWANRA